MLGNRLGTIKAKAAARKVPTCSEELLYIVTAPINYVRNISELLGGLKCH